jgi:sialic acid synthase SpsE
MAKKRVYIIAEAGVNHNGNEKKALELIRIAVRAGADAVKFQLFDPKELVTVSAPTAGYQAKNLRNSKISQRDMLKSLCLPEGALPRLEKACRKHRIDFLCTPFDHHSLQYLTENTCMRYLKLPSGEVTNGPLLLAAARTKLPIILSTGMSDLQEIGIALSILYYGYMHKKGYPARLIQPTAAALKVLRSRVTLLHCVSQYPAPVSSMNLRAIDTLKRTFGLPVGLSDHSLGITMPLAAAALGAVIIEKHFTYDKKASGPDHKASLESDEFKAMVASLRAFEQDGEIDLHRFKEGMGDGRKRCQPIERNTRDIARKSVVAAKPITPGVTFTEANLACKRPATGDVVPNKLWSLLGRKAKRRYGIDEFIKANELK